MLDFVRIATRVNQRKVTEIYPNFRVGRSSDLMIRGGDFYAVWRKDIGLWSTDEDDVIEMIDAELDRYAAEYSKTLDGPYRVLRMRDSESGVIDAWHKYCQKQQRDNFHPLDERLIFANTETTKEDYASKKLPYVLGPGPTDAYDKLMSVLYDDEERHKLEWAIGSIVSGDSKKIQKFVVLYGAAGTGKSTVLNIIQKMFDGYYSVFDARALGSASNSFALEAFKTNPLVAIQHDGDLSHIEDNTRLNSLVSHELMTVNEKFKSAYSNRFNCFLFMGTNKPVKITDAKSGLIRRLIDVSPTGEKVSSSEYKKLYKQIGFEIGAIANHCLGVYNQDPGYYDNYIPINMLGASNDFYNFVEDSYFVFKQEDGTSLKAAWELYKRYCEEARVPYALPQRIFKEELKNYFREYTERGTASDGTRVRSYYSGFIESRFDSMKEHNDEPKDSSILDFGYYRSKFDSICSDYPAQYATESGTPMAKWADVTTTLKDIDTSKLHYVKVPKNLIVIDFDIPSADGKKDFARNLEEASKWPATYAELSKSGGGIHLHYFYTGDPEKLSRVYAEHIEIKVYTGNSSLRRLLTKCTDHEIAFIGSGLPLKEEKKIVNEDIVTTEKGLRTTISKCLAKEIHPEGTRPNIDFIYKVLEDAYNKGLEYDVSDLRGKIFAFAASSTNQSEYCVKLAKKMKFHSDHFADIQESVDTPIVFYDVEVFPNLFLVNWKYQGESKKVVRMINPSPAEIEKLCKFRLIGFNCRRYDNHILYARLLGYSNQQLYELSQQIINNRRNCLFGEAYNLSYTDVYDFSSTKQSLKKFEIELHIHHKELGLSWDQPVPEELWPRVAEYCDNDVIATEIVFNARQADFLARKILAEIAGMTVNDTTNSLTTKIIFGGNKSPQSVFNYRDLGDISDPKLVTPKGYDPEYTKFRIDGKPVFPGYKYEYGKSSYRGEEIGEGGYVYAEPGVYTNVALLDIASMHPSSIIAENLFGDEYTQRFKDIRDMRLLIKHKELDKARTLLNGALVKYLADEKTAADLAQALKIAINSVYGLTSAKFDNPFRDVRNVDNIVAKRGELFMINLKHEVQARGFTVAHIKTDSIKIPNATKEIIEFVQTYGELYGYTFEHEATYERMCLVNDAVYVARYDTADACMEKYGYVPSDIRKHGGEWTATGTQFQVPYVFKTLFSGEEITLEDMSETKSVSTALYLYDGKDYTFVGKVGEFCPIDEAHGQELLRYVEEKDGKPASYSAATGTKGYHWLESETVRNNGLENFVDRSYYSKLVNDAADAISKYCDIEWFRAA